MRLNVSLVKIIGKSNPFWLNYEPKLRGDSQLPSVMQSAHGLMPVVLVV